MTFSPYCSNDLNPANPNLVEPAEGSIHRLLAENSLLKASNRDALRDLRRSDFLINDLQDALNTLKIRAESAEKRLSEAETRITGLQYIPSFAEFYCLLISTSLQGCPTTWIASLWRPITQLASSTLEVPFPLSSCMTCRTEFEKWLHMVLIVEYP